jgi:hypothetical protein
MILIKTIICLLRVRKVNDKVFNERKKNAGKVAEDWRSTLDAKLKDIEASESQSQKES